MAFNTAPGRAEYTASAAQTKFTFAFKIFNTSDVKVYLTPAGQTADDTADLLIETTDYTISINGDNGGDVDLTSGATLNDGITLVRELPTVRDTEYQQNGDLTAEALNEDQNYQTYLILDGATVSERALTVPDSVQSFDTEIPSPIASKLLLFNGDASGFDLLDPASTSLFKDSFIVDSIAAMGGVDPNIYSTVIVRGYYTANDGGGGLFNYDATQSAVNNGGTIIDGWVRQYSGAVSAKWFPTIQNALDNHDNVVIPEGTYTEHFSVKSGQTVRGEGTEKTILTPVDAAPVIIIYGTDDFIISPVLEGFSVYGTDMVNSTGIRLYKAMRLPQIRDVKVFNFTRGIKLRRVYNLVCESVWVQSNEIGIFMDSRVNACEFNSLMIINNTVAGIKTEDNYPTEDSLPAYYNKITTIINNCDIENNEIGIHTTGSSLGLILEDNYYENNTQYGIKLDGNVNFEDDATVISNSTFSGAGSRIYIGEYATYTIVAGNVAHGIGATNYLLDVHASATNLLIGQNRNYGNGLGIYDPTATGTDANIDEYNGSRRKITNKSLLLSGGNVRITDGSLEIDNMDYDGQVTKFGSRYVWVDQYGSFRHSTSSPSTSLSGRPFVQMVDVPSTATSAGKIGDIASDSLYAYFYIGDGVSHQWKRVAIISW